MSFSATPTYAELKTAVANWLHRSDLTNYVDDLILMGEKYVVRHARTRDMETSLNVTMSSGVAAIPTDFVALKHARIDGTPSTTLQPKPADWIMLRYPLRSAESMPKFIGIDGSNFVFGPYPSSDFTVKGTYYKRLTAVASSANALFTNNPDLYLFAALAEAAPFLKNDARVPMWEAKRNIILQDVNGEDQNARYSGGPLTMVPA
jgi:hypothetical protein